jgi:hypothetical protein
MSDDRTSTSRLGLLLAAAVAVALAVFLATGGDLGGTKKVESDADLPKVTSPTPPTGDNTGSRR